MDYEEQIGIIELGNLKIRCLIFKIINNKAELLSSVINDSAGIHNDIIINLEKAAKAVRSCIANSEKKANISLKKINVVFEQPDFLCTKFSKNKKIDGSKIQKDDIDFLLKEAKKQLILNDKKQSIIHIFNHNYIIDGKEFLDEPIGVYADTLTHEIVFITTPKNNLKNIYQVFFDCDIEVARIISRTFASGVELLDNNELKFGAAILDLGFEKTSFGLFKNLTPVHSTTFPVGINHITKDISKVCSLDIGDSENIKDNIDFSFQKNLNLFDENSYLKNVYFNNSSYRKISKDLIFSIVKARLDEISDMVKKQLVVPGFKSNSGINFVIVGGGSKLSNIENYFAKHLGFNVKNKDNDNKVKKTSLEKDFTSCLGALKIIKDGWETEAIPETRGTNVKKKGFFARIFNMNE